MPLLTCCVRLRGKGTDDVPEWRPKEATVFPITISLHPNEKRPLRAV
jgi:hypothetical protein